MLGTTVWRKLLFLLRRRRFQRELNEEMQLHVDLRARQLRGSAISGADAEARRRFGNQPLLRERSQDVWAWRWIEDGWQDLRFAARLLRKKPGAAAVAALTLALGIGAASSVFSMVDAVLLRPLPYRDPGRLVAIWARGVHEKGLEKVFAPYDDFAQWSRMARSFESVAAATWAFAPQRTLTGRGPARQLLAIPVSASFFETLGVQAALGRTFTADDERRGCAVVLSHGFWTTTLGADAAVVGRSLTLDRRPCTVLGVMPRTFSFYPPVAPMWMLLGPDFEPPRDRATVGIFARLKPGVTLAQAQAEVAALHRTLHPDRFWRDFEPVVYDLHGEFTFLASRTLRITLLVVFAAVLLVLLIACLNVANLLLARLSERQRELALRAALGSGQARLVRQVLTEGLLLSVIGAGAGVLLADAAVLYFRAASPIELTAGADVRLNLPVLLFSGGLALATTMLFALLPALSASRFDLTERLKTGGRGAVGAGVRLGTAKTMIAVEVGLSFVLLIGAGLLLRSALRMGSEPLGFNPDRLVQTRTSLPAWRYGDPALRAAFYDRLLDRLTRLPGVAGAALSSRVPPYASDGGTEALEIQGRAPTGGALRHDVGLNTVSPRFFALLGMPLVEGRAFEATDRAGSPAVAIVNESLAREYFRGTDPIGKQIRLDRRADAAMPWMTIVGICSDLKHPELMNEMSWVTTPVLYRPLSQDPRPGIEIAVRLTAGGPPLGDRIQEEIAALDASVPVNAVEAVAGEISRTLAYPRFRAFVLGFFALTALLLCAVGLHGVLSQLVTQRTSEFGVRKAVGAQNRDLLLLVARQGGIPVAAGLACGIGGTTIFSRLLTSLLYGVRPVDPGVLMGVSAVLLAVSGLAVALPARRAASVDPMVALRDE